MKFILLISLIHISSQSTVLRNLDVYEATPPRYYESFPVYINTVPSLYERLFDVLHQGLGVFSDILTIPDNSAIHEYFHVDRVVQTLNTLYTADPNVEPCLNIDVLNDIFFDYMFQMVQTVVKMVFHYPVLSTEQMDVLRSMFDPDQVRALTADATNTVCLRMVGDEVMDEDYDVEDAGDLSSNSTDEGVNFTDGSNSTDIRSDSMSEGLNSTDIGSDYDSENTSTDIPLHTLANLTIPLISWPPQPNCSESVIPDREDGTFIIGQISYEGHLSTPQIIDNYYVAWTTQSPDYVVSIDSPWGGYMAHQLVDQDNVKILHLYMGVDNVNYTLSNTCHVVTPQTSVLCSVEYVISANTSKNTFFWHQTIDHDQHLVVGTFIDPETNTTIQVGRVFKMNNETTPVEVYTFKGHIESALVPRNSCCDIPGVDIMVSAPFTAVELAYEPEIKVELRDTGCQTMQAQISTLGNNSIPVAFIRR